MRRRRFLATLAGGAAGTAGVGVRARARSAASAHPSDADADGGSAATATPATPTPTDTTTPLARLGIEGAREAVVAGDTVHVATLDGFATVDASDPTDPTLLSRRAPVLEDAEDGPLGGIQDCSVDGDRLLIAGPANFHTDLAAAVLFDVSDPANPERVGVHRTTYPIHNCYLADGVGYLTGNGAAGNPLVTIDPAAGDELGRWTLLDRDERWTTVPGNLRALHDVQVRGDRAYLAHWDAGTWILDVSDPGTPTVVSRVRGRSAAELADVPDDETGVEGVETPGNDHFVTVNPAGDLLGVGIEAWDADGDGEGAPGGIELYDLGDETDPERVGRLDPPPTSDPARSGVWTTAHNFAFRDGRCYAAWYQGGVTVHDVSDPARPREVAAWRDTDRTRFWTAVPGDGWFAAASMPMDEAEAGLYLFPGPGAGGVTAGSGGESGAGTGTTRGSGTATSTAAPTDEPDRPTSVTSEPSVIGGVAAAAAAAAALVWRYRR